SRFRLYSALGGAPCSTLTKGTRTTRASGFVLRMTCAHVRALRAPLSISRDWCKKKRVTTTDETGYWREPACIVHETMLQNLSKKFASAFAVRKNAGGCLKPA